MVQQPVLRNASNRHARPAGDGPRPDPVRIAGISGTLLLNGALLLVMLVPLSRPAEEAPPRRGLEAEWFEPRPVPPLPPPEEVPVMPEPPRPVAAAPVRRVQSPPQAPVAPPVVEGGSLAAEPPVEGDAVGPELAPPATGPALGVHLAYRRASAPPYPAEALRSGHQGTVVLKVLVDVDGRPLEVRVESSSGYRRLDEAARRHVLRNWTFQPAVRDGRPVQAVGLVPIEFRVDRG